jgi:uncharacterized protein involved in exopolysaccharide biosynthesis
VRPLDTRNTHFAVEVSEAAHQPNWVTNASLLWEHRHKLARITGLALVLSAIIAFVIPKQYESVARIMPPEQANSGVAALAALAGRSSGGLGAFGSLAGSLFNVKNSGELFIDLLHSRTVSDHLIDRFHLQSVYGKRYRIDTVKYLTRQTKTVDDKKSGVISITYTDTDPKRAQAITQAYLDELNLMVMKSNTSSARRERQFIENRLVNVRSDLENAETALGDFSSTNTTLDIKEQTHAMVEAGARLQGELIAAQSTLDSLQQIYGTDNVRVRAARARIDLLKSDLVKISGNSTALAKNGGKSDDQSSDTLYPPLRQLPHLAVPYANLYRRVRVEETVFELLSQQYEMARIEEAKDTPVVSVIDPPLVAEKKSFPPRLLVIFLLTLTSLLLASVFIITRHRWRLVDSRDQRKVLARDIGSTLRSATARMMPKKRGVA